MKKGLIFLIPLIVFGVGIYYWLMPTAEATDLNRVEKIISEMSIQEKIAYIGGYKEFNVRGYEKYGIPEIHISDGPVGLRNYGASTAYPAAIALAASWDHKIAEKVGKAIGMEAKAKNVHLMLGPGMNLYRMPVCGRNFEYLGEDPFLAGELGTAYIKGMQAEGVMANAKHYVANNQEFNRHHGSSDMDERTLFELYMPAFKRSVQKGKVASVMTAYNLINGVHASEHDFLNNKVLKGKWGFKGFTISDWVSTYDGIACAKGGLDLEMPSGKMMSEAVLLPAIESGAVTEEVIDDKVRRLLNTFERFGYFENPDISVGFELDTLIPRQAALAAARGGMVLLENKDQMLPFQKEIQSIAVIGPNAAELVSGGGGSSFVQPLHPMSLVEAVQQVAGAEVQVATEPGIFTGVPFPDDMFEKHDQFYAYKEGEKVQGVFAAYFLGKELKGEPILQRYHDQLHLTDDQLWEASEVPKTNFSVRFTTYFKPETSGYYSIGASGDDGYRVLLDEVEILNLWRDQGDTKSKYDGFFNAGQEYQVTVEYYQAGGGATIKLGAKKVVLETAPTEYLSKAIALAKKSDVVVLAVGFNPFSEGESFDRSYEMPFDQATLINEIAKVNKEVVVVLNAGGNVEMDAWIDQAKALLMAWYPGQEGNLAVAEILMGKTNPSGKLPASFEVRLEENPCFAHYYDDDKDGKVFYGEGLSMGYRYWDAVDEKPRYPFGYGLSYTSFTYDAIELPKKQYAIGDSIELSFTLSNVGSYEGAEVVQLYLADKECSLDRPVKELKGFTKVFLKAGASQKVYLTVSPDDFAFYNPAKHSWEVEPGEFEIILAASSEDIRQSATVVLN